MASAHAKVSFRIVGGQEPAAVVESFDRHVAERLPDGVTASVTQLAGPSWPYALVSDNPLVDVARHALAEGFDLASAGDVALTREGGSGPWLWCHGG
jgi:acetylornithine deacetylase/succinyl-diaminopimelate desuccinylase-like protein